jgi:hypothetical protein
MAVEYAVAREYADVSAALMVKSAEKGRKINDKIIEVHEVANDY